MRISSFVVGLVLAALALLRGAEFSEEVFCIQQGMLLLDQPTKPTGSPLDWPFCKEYQSCSCCNVSHAVTIQRSIAVNDAVLTPCQEALASAACRVCHPEVGTGILESVCRSQCDAWYAVCEQDYFAFDPIAARLSHCRDDGQLICSQLQYLCHDGSCFCDHMGLKISQSVEEDCWFRDRGVQASLCSDPLDLAPSLRISDFKYVYILLLLLVLVWSAAYCQL